MKKVMNCCKNKVKYSKVVTAGNDPSITNRMRYSKYINNTRSASLVSTPVNYINQVNTFVSQYILKYNTNIKINLDNFNVFVQEYIFKTNIKSIVNDIETIPTLKYDYANNELLNELNKLFQDYKNNNGSVVNINIFFLFLYNLNAFLQQYSENPNTFDLNIDVVTANFIKGSITAEFYYTYLSNIFINSNDDYLSGLINGMLPLLPTEKAYYLKNYAIIVNPYGSIWPHYDSIQPTKTNINFLKYY